ncbi:Protein trichome birefringence-like 36, partial [Bienertia sinuspersici]
MPIKVAYGKAMKTWVKWIEENVDPSKTIVFFRSISAQHIAKQWCYNSTQPIFDEFLQKHISEHHKLFGYRIDAHPSVYKSLEWIIDAPKYKRPRKPLADCSHWCLPGLPDTWNRLLYSSLFFDYIREYNY